VSITPGKQEEFEIPVCLQHKKQQSPPKNYLQQQLSLFLLDHQCSAFSNSGTPHRSHRSLSPLLKDLTFGKLASPVTALSTPSGTSEQQRQTVARLIEKEGRIVLKPRRSLLCIVLKYND
jgi:hypothetical protein